MRINTGTDLKKRKRISEISTVQVGYFTALGPVSTHLKLLFLSFENLHASVGFET